MNITPEFAKCGLCDIYAHFGIFQSNGEAAVLTTLLSFKAMEATSHFKGSYKATRETSVFPQESNITFQSHTPPFSSGVPARYPGPKKDWVIPSSAAALSGNMSTGMPKTQQTPTPDKKRKGRAALKHGNSHISLFIFIRGNNTIVFFIKGNHKLSIKVRKSPKIKMNLMFRKKIVFCYPLSLEIRNETLLPE